MAKKVVVAVKASKEIPKTSLVWALSHVVQPGDCITLLVVSSHCRKWPFPRFSGDCASSSRKSQTGSSSEQNSGIGDSFSQMILRLHDVYDPNKLQKLSKLKLVGLYWTSNIVQLKHEEKRCMEELQYNIVIMKRSQAKVLRLNLVGASEKEAEACQLNPETDEISEKHPKNKNASSPCGAVAAEAKQAQASWVAAQTRGKALNGGVAMQHSDYEAFSGKSAALKFDIRSVVTPISSPELGTSFTATEAGTSSVSSSDPGISPFCTSESNTDSKKEESLVIKENQDLDESISDQRSSLYLEQPSGRANVRAQASTTKALLEKFSKLDREAGIGMSSFRSDIEFSGSVREAVALSRNSPPGPRPLCSICQHKAPGFGKPPRWFTHAELELATDGFSQANFLAEGGFGSAYRGVLPDGQAIAVKQHKLASSQGDHDFCSEIEVLSCDQHRNVVMLIGFCIEDRPRLLVGDFGLVRWLPDGDAGVETRVYLAPEYAETGQITEKADVYSLGVVLVELFTGQKAMDLNRPKGQQCLTERARPLLEEYAIDELVDPRLEDRYSEHEVYRMLHAASLCIRRDPHSRPRMSQVLRILEGDMLMDTNYASTGFDIGKRRGQIFAKQQYYSGSLANEVLEDFSGKLSHDGLR
ncbi:Inactive protein kinase [Hibiscus syriacus]|uniref:Inactive protein kinase n=1 Tax=Hibiscus syriacus TaxID=106335 RepID=A0A6A2WKX7_HIBSY|nr:Inactive protein kinase [Hibiscus syriacus]